MTSSMLEGRKEIEDIRSLGWKKKGLVNHDLEGYRYCKMVVKEIVSRLLEEEEVSHFGKEAMIYGVMFWFSILVLRHLWFSETLEWRFEQDVWTLGDLSFEENSFETERKDWDEKIRHHFPRWNHPMDEMTMDDLEWRRRS
ncbi:hypothetical protein Tco_0999469 [Tanacetum coccineum]